MAGGLEMQFSEFLVLTFFHLLDKPSKSLEFRMILSDLFGNDKETPIFDPFQVRRLRQAVHGCGIFANCSRLVTENNCRVEIEYIFIC